MTKEQFNKLFNDTLTAANIHLIIEEAKNKILDSGAVNLSEYDHETSPYALPKAVLFAAVNEVLWRLKPLTKEGQKIANNLTKFT